VRTVKRLVVVLSVLVAVVATACDSSSSSEHSASARSSPAPAPVDVGTRTHVTSTDKALTLETTSARAAFVSGDDVLVTLSGSKARDARVTRNGADVTRALVAAGALRRGVVDGLREGKNTLTAVAGDSKVELTIDNHPKNGPLFAGAHLEPWVCTTKAAGLGAATDDDCDAPTKTSWSYKSTDGSIKPQTATSSRPADLAMTSVHGTRVPFIIRTEVGVIDRGIYWIWVLDPDAGSQGDDANEWKPAAWNERLVYRFGGGCGTQYSQGTPLAVGLDADLVGRGYALATNTLDTFQTACNDVLSSEAAMMTREHFVEAYGVPRFTIGDGGSGGAIQQLLLAYNYPGVLDALSPALPFPDAVSIAGGVTDCGLLVHYYSTSHGASLSPAQRAAINGHATAGSCELWDRLFVGGVNPFDGCDPSIPKDELYDPKTNPDGARCTLQDINVEVLGRDPKTGFARRPLDNVGVEYGLAALNKRVITVDQFLDVNEFVGGYDIDGTIVPERAEADEASIAVAYRTGRVTEAGPLADVPIVLRNVDTDQLGDIHTRVHPFSIRDRLQRDGKDDPNLLLWTTPPGGTNLASNLLGNIGDANAPISVLDEWLTNLDKTDPHDSMADRLAAAKPKDATNRCMLPNGRVLSGGWEIYDDPGPCRDAYPVYAEPRIAAGAPQRADIVKCQLMPATGAKFDVPLNDAQRARLVRIFPDGVCDWSKPGVGQQAPQGVWRTYGN
jgi:hypothetical protein